MSPNFPVRDGSLVLYVPRRNSAQKYHSRGIIFDISKGHVHAIWDDSERDSYTLRQVREAIEGGIWVVEVY